MNVGGVLDPGREAPRTAQAETAGLRNSGTRPGTLTGNHRQPFTAEQFGDRFVTKVGRAGADGERRRHQHPAGGQGAKAGEPLLVERVPLGVLVDFPSGFVTRERKITRAPGGGNIGRW